MIGLLITLFFAVLGWEDGDRSGERTPKLQDQHLGGTILNQPEANRARALKKP
jgi:hypothetical protein